MRDDAPQRRPGPAAFREGLERPDRQLAAGRRVLPLKEDWQFCLEAPTARLQLSGLDPSGWRRVRVPHDWSIEGTVDPANPSGRNGGFYPGGVGWYSRLVHVPSLWRDQRVWIEFDGVYMNSDVWVNEHHLGYHPYGYTPFRYDLTNFVHQGADNRLAVRVDNSAQPNSRWYSGSGIYRDVNLVVAPSVHIAPDGIAIRTPEINAGRALIEAQLSVMNHRNEFARATLFLQVTDPSGTPVCEAGIPVTLQPGARQVVREHFQVENPALWSAEIPVLHHLKCRLHTHGGDTDGCLVKFGIRKITMKPDSGLFLNGEPVKLKGVCLHHDLGGVGAAVPTPLLRTRLNLLKAMGCNAIRTAHNPASRAFISLCDELGFLVIEEVFDDWELGKTPHGYHTHFRDWWKTDLSAVIRRDHNSPSVIMWSIGNEMRERALPQGAEWACTLRDACHQLDRTRPVTAGINAVWEANECGVPRHLDVVGYNGGGGSCFDYEEDHAAYPDRLMYASEVPHTFQTRGVYRTRTWWRDPPGDGRHGRRITLPDLTAREVFPDEKPLLHSSYDNALVRINSRESWRRTRSLPWLMGEFRWTGCDYLGESSGWPSRMFQGGVIDLCGFPKDTYYFYQAQWTRKPMVYLLPHWTHPGKEGVQIPVWMYTNGDEGELLLNGRSLGRRTVHEDVKLSWMVPYEPGELVGKAFRNGDCVAKTVLRTAGPAKEVILTASPSRIQADGDDVSAVTAMVADSAGIPVPRSCARITFDVAGPGRLLGVENGDPLDHESCRARTRGAFQGRCLALIQSNGDTGTIEIRARTPELPRKGSDKPGWEGAYRDTLETRWNSCSTSVSVVAASGT